MTVRFVLHRHETLTSTSDEAASLARAGAPEGTVVIAGEQTRGRGRLGRPWHSPPGSGLYLSIILRPDIAPDRLPRLTLLVAVGVVTAIRGATGLQAAIKWPNDIWIGCRKIGGILCEGALGSGNTRGNVVIGVGLNTGPIQGPLEILHTATSISCELGRDVDRNEILDAVLLHVGDLYSGWRDDRWSDSCWLDILALFRQHCLTLGRRVTVTSGKGSYQGKALDVDEDGALLVRVAGGSIRRALAGDVTLSGRGV